MVSAHPLLIERYRSSSAFAEQFTFLAGVVAPVEYQNLVTYKVGGATRLCTKQSA